MRYVVVHLPYDSRETRQGCECEQLSICNERLEEDIAEAVNEDGKPIGGLRVPYTMASRLVLPMTRHE